MGPHVNARVQCANKTVERKRCISSPDDPKTRVELNCSVEIRMAKGAFLSAHFLVSFCYLVSNFFLDYATVIQILDKVFLFQFCTNVLVKSIEPSTFSIYRLIVGKTDLSNVGKEIIRRILGFQEQMWLGTTSGRQSPKNSTDEYPS